MSCKGGTLLEVVNSIWLFFQDQILGMKWLNGLIGNGLSLLGLDINSRLGGSIQFFLYDVIKITILLCLRPFYHSESGKITMQVDEELKGQIHTEMMKAILKFEIRVK